MNYGANSNNSRVKLFGIEDFWGNSKDGIDGLFCNSSRQILTSTDNFNNNATGYINQGEVSINNLGSYMTKPLGASETGFIAKEANGGSKTTYFCDIAILDANRYPNFADIRDSNGEGAGVFALSIYYPSSFTNTDTGARLMYL